MILFFSMTNLRVIGVAGLPGAGTSSVAEAIRNQTGGYVFHSADYLANLGTSFGIGTGETTPQNVTETYEQIAPTYGRGFLGRAAVTEAQNAFADTLILDGVVTAQDYEAAAEKADTHFIGIIGAHYSVRLLRQQRAGKLSAAMERADMRMQDNEHLSGRLFPAGDVLRIPGAEHYGNPHANRQSVKDKQIMRIATNLIAKVEKQG